MLMCAHAIFKIAVVARFRWSFLGTFVFAPLNPTYDLYFDSNGQLVYSRGSILLSTNIPIAKGGTKEKHTRNMQDFSLDAHSAHFKDMSARKQ